MCALSVATLLLSRSTMPSTRWWPHNEFQVYIRKPAIHPQGPVRSSTAPPPDTYPLYCTGAWNLNGAYHMSSRSTQYRVYLLRCDDCSFLISTVRAVTKRILNRNMGSFMYKPSSFVSTLINTFTKASVHRSEFSVGPTVVLTRGFST